jgi:hypothetical protein
MALRGPKRWRQCAFGYECFQGFAVRSVAKPAHLQHRGPTCRAAAFPVFSSPNIRFLYFSAARPADMKFKILTSPERILVYACIVLVLGGAMIWFDDQRISRSALPMVEASVSQELDEIIRQSPGLQGLKLGERRRARVVGHDPQSLTGFLEFNAMQDGLWTEVRVSWKTSGTNCHVTQIVSHHPGNPEKVVWGQND